MDRSLPLLLRVAATSIAICFSICIDAAPAEHIQTNIADGLARVNAARSSAANDSRLRPKFVDGQAVAATGITYREVFWTGKPRD